jgi:hypothetical protein
MADFRAVEAALLAVLVNDATLAAILTDGWFYDVAKQGSTRHGIVSLLDHSEESVYVAGRAVEDALFLVKAVTLSTSSADVLAAAARIDVLLQDQSLTAAGYNWMSCAREARVRMTQADVVDLSLRWQHCGGHYRVQMSLVGA